jgi:WD domain, G-beta repeat
VSSDGKRLATLGTGQQLKIWNVENGQPVVQRTGDFELDKLFLSKQRLAALRQQYIDLAKQDLDEHQKTIAAEEQNLAKSNEEQKTSEANQTAKIELAKTAEAAKTAADADLAAKTAQFAEFEKQIAAAVEEVTKQDALVKAKMEAVQVSVTALTTVQAEATQLEQTKNQTQQQSDAQPDNAELKQQLATQIAMLDESKKKVEAANLSKTTAEQEQTAALQTQQAAQQKKNELDQQLSQLKPMKDQAEQKVKEVTDAFKKAKDEELAAIRAFEGAKRSVERGTLTVETAKQRLPELQTTIQSSEQIRAQIDQVVQMSQQQAEMAKVPWKSVTFADGGRVVVGVNQQNRCFAFSAETGEPIDAWNMECDRLFNLADGMVASFFSGKTRVEIWSASLPWTLSRTIGSPTEDVFADRVTSLAFSNDGELLATGSGEPSRGGQIKIWKSGTGEFVREIESPHSDIVLGLAFSPDDRLIASCAADRFMKVFDLTTGQLVRAFEGHTHHVIDVSWSADSRFLATSGADKVVKVWDARSGEQKQTIGGFGKEVTGVKFIENRRQVIASSADSTVRMFDALSAGQLRAFGGFGDYVYAVDVSDDGAIYAAGGYESKVIVWREDAQSLVQFDPPAPPAPVTQ